jgi:hypothetical protein
LRCTRYSRSARAIFLRRLAVRLRFGHPRLSARNSGQGLLRRHRCRRYLHRHESSTFGLSRRTLLKLGRPDDEAGWQTVRRLIAALERNAIKSLTRPIAVETCRSSSRNLRLPGVTPEGMSVPTYAEPPLGRIVQRAIARNP